MNFDDKKQMRWSVGVAATYGRVAATLASATSKHPFYIGDKQHKTVEQIQAEIVEWCLKNNLEARIADYLKAVARSSVVIGLDEEIATVMGRINHERKQKARGWGMVDSLILAIAASYDMSVLTGDVHFKDLPDATILSA